jgi:transcriptional regulator with XRE-family HTH domain
LPHPPKNVQFSKGEIGRRIRTLREERAITQVELAKMLGIHQTNVSAMERGIRGITIHQLAKLSKVLRVSPDQILGGRAQGPRRPLKSLKLLRRLQRIERLPEAKQRAVMRVIDALLNEEAKTA